MGRSLPSQVRGEADADGDGSGSGEALDGMRTRRGMRLEIGFGKGVYSSSPALDQS